MFNARKKIVKADGCTPSELEDEVAKCLFDLEVSNNSELKAEARDIVISSAKHVEVPNTCRKVIVVFIPFRVYQNNVRKIHSKLVIEFEKKLKQQVVLVAQRTVLPKKVRTAGVRFRPRSRTLTSVQESVLEDIVGPTTIVAKRTLYKQDGSKLLKVHLDPKDKVKENIEEKLDTFAAVYKSLTTQDAVFQFPSNAA